MSGLAMLGLVLAILVFCYLVAVLLHPENFS